MRQLFMQEQWAWWPIITKVPEQRKRSDPIGDLARKLPAFVWLRLYSILQRIVPWQKAAIAVARWHFVQSRPGPLDLIIDYAVNGTHLGHS
jgi:hypothetical protein